MMTTTEKILCVLKNVRSCFNSLEEMDATIALLEGPITSDSKLCPLNGKFCTKKCAWFDSISEDCCVKKKTGV